MAHPIQCENVERIELGGGYHFKIFTGGDYALCLPDGTYALPSFNLEEVQAFAKAMSPQPTASVVECAQAILMQAVGADHTSNFDYDETKAASIIQALLDAETAKHNARAMEVIGELVDALQGMVYQTTHLSPEHEDGSHECRISKGALKVSRDALATARQFRGK